MLKVSIVLLGVLGVAWVYLRPTAASRRLRFEQGVDRLEAFVYGGGRAHDWDYLISVRHPNPRAEAIRQRILELQRSIPGEDYSADMLLALRKLLEEIRATPNWPSSTGEPPTP